MFHIEILQYRWLFLGILGGLALVFALALTYIALWQPRRPHDPKSPYGQHGWIPLRLAIPWFLILTYVGTLLYGIVYVIMTAANPPNW